jgi:glucan phosphoethanolaminetransferase (alkaline phosphatase superfamily)
MPSPNELRLFQAAVIVASVVPIAAGAAGVLHGPGMIRGFARSNADLDSHFSYLSGLLLGIGLAFLFCVLRVRARAQSFRMLGLIVIAAGLARAFAASRLGFPRAGHQFAYVMELVVVPALLVWHRRIERLPTGER